MKRLRVGLAGIGALYWPVAMAEGLAARGDAVLTSFATLGQTPESIEAGLGMGPETYARRYGLTSYRDAAVMAETESLDALVLCTRHTAHARWVERLGKLGRDICVLKTFATTERDARRIVEAGRKHRIRIAVGPSARYLPWFVTVREALASGRIGKPFSLRIAHHHGTLDVFGPQDFYRDPREGGPELSLGWYLVDLVMAFLGKVSEVTALYGTYTTPSSPFMDCGKMLLRTEGGGQASCDMYFCNRFAYPSWEMDLVGDQGALRLRDEGPTGPRVTLTTPAGSRVLSPRGKPVRGAWETFWVDDFRSRGKPAVDAGWAAEVTRVCLAARKSAHRGGTIRLTRRS